MGGGHEASSRLAMLRFPPLLIGGAHAVTSSSPARIARLRFPPLLIGGAHAAVEGLAEVRGRG